MSIVEQGINEMSDTYGWLQSACWDYCGDSEDAFNDEGVLDDLLGDHLCDLGIAQGEAARDDELIKLIQIAVGSRHTALEAVLWRLVG